MGGKHSQRLLTPLHYCANGMIVLPPSAARSLDLSFHTHLPPFAHARSRQWRQRMSRRNGSNGSSENIHVLKGAHQQEQNMCTTCKQRGGLICYRRSLLLALFTIQLRLTLIIKRPLNFTKERSAAILLAQLKTRSFVP